MTSEVRQPATAATRAPSRARGAKLRAYARLAKLDVFDYYLSALVVLTLMAPGERPAGRSLLTLALFLLGEVCVVAATVSFDDVTGYLDGSDAANYGPDAPLRRLARKPLLAGTLTPDEAVRFGRAAAAAGTVLWAAAVAAAPHRPAWALGVTGICLAIALQYSWGLRLGYRGLQEFTLWGFGAGVVLAPFGLTSQAALAFPAVQAVLFGMGPLLFGVYSNTNDAAGDRGVGRRTVAASVSPRWNAAFIAGLSVAETLVIFGSAVVGAAPWWFPLAMLPVVGLRGVQAVRGLGRGDVLGARRLGIRIHRIAVALLVTVNLLALLLDGRPA